MNRISGREAIRRIRKVITLDPRNFTTLSAGDDIFSKAVATILSQNTNDRNSIEAYRRLEQVVDINPYNLLKIDIDRIIEAIKISGLYIQKAQTIKNLAMKVIEELNGRLENLQHMDLENARRWLLSIKGIGKKTADIILIHLGFPTFPVDTHISRVTCRIGYTSRREYDEVSRFWIEELDRDEYLEAHLLLIEFGRRVCRSRSPRCGDCILREYCLYYTSNGENCKA